MTEILSPGYHPSMTVPNTKSFHSSLCSFEAGSPMNTIFDFPPSSRDSSDSFEDENQALANSPIRFQAETHYSDYDIKVADLRRSSFVLASAPETSPTDRCSESNSFLMNRKNSGSATVLKRTVSLPTGDLVATSLRDAAASCDEAHMEQVRARVRMAAWKVMKAQQAMDAIYLHQAKLSEFNEYDKEYHQEAGSDKHPRRRHSTSSEKPYFHSTRSFQAHPDEIGPTFWSWVSSMLLGSTWKRRY